MLQAAPSTRHHPSARPFLKWAGGKAKLAHHILERFPATFGRYYEPFVGGGAIFFALDPKRACLADINPHLISTYEAIRDNVEEVIARLRRYPVSREHFYRVRAQNPTRLQPASLAARTIYLNRTCFNGLYRVNKSGAFNVPYGSYTAPIICHADNLRRVADRLRGVTLRCQGVEAVGRQARRGDLVYLDPPYMPLSKTSSFVGYAKGGFDFAAQLRLARLFIRLANRGVAVVQSNADVPEMWQMYQGFRIDRIAARRAINCQAAHRGPVTELIISSQPVASQNH